MNQGIVANLALGWVVFAAICLLALGGLAGGLWASRRFRLKAERQSAAGFSQRNELMNALPFPALIVNMEARILLSNPRGAELLRELDRPGQLPLAVDAAVVRVLTSRLTETIEVAAFGSVQRLQVSIIPFQAGNQAVEALVLFIDLRSGSNRAEVYQRLISTLAHELRTPLTAIMGHIEILNSLQPEEEVLRQRSLGFVAAEAERLARLVEDILSLSRLDRISLRLQPVNLKVIVEEALSELLSAPDPNQVIPVIQAPNELPRVLVDPDRMRQVFLNLMDNAIKYAPGCTLTIRLAPQAEMVWVEVSDNGPGIPSEDLPHIFEPFYRIHRPAEAPNQEKGPQGKQGTGLGLTIVSAILEQHHAQIRAVSAPGQGTRFSFTLTAFRTRSGG